MKRRMRIGERGRGERGRGEEKEEMEGMRITERGEKKPRRGRREEEEARPHTRAADPIHPLPGTSHPSHHLPLAGRVRGSTRGRSSGCWQEEEEKGRDPCPCFLGQHRRHSHHIWLPCPPGVGDSLYLEPVPCSQPPRSCQGESRHIPAPSSTTQPGRAMLSAFIQLMQQSIQEKKNNNETMKFQTLTVKNQILPKNQPELKDSPTSDCT